MTPLDRAAQAIRDELGDYAVDDDTWMAEGGLKSSGYYRDIIHAVLKAIREPSEAMLAAGSNEVFGERGHYLFCREQTRRGFTAMIDAALEEDG